MTDIRYEADFYTAAAVEGQNASVLVQEALTRWHTEEQS